jgi:hypothetical protein
VTVWDEIAAAASRESDLWAQSLLPSGERQLLEVFSPLASQRFALGVETIYEGYLAHYGRPRLFAPADDDTALLLGDYLYAHGLVRISELGDVDAVRELAELISRCAHLRADGRAGDGEAWAETVGRLGEAIGEPDGLRRSALAAHRRLVAQRVR